MNKKKATNDRGLRRMMLANDRGLHRMMLEDLKRSGLDAKDAEKMGLEPKYSEEAAKAGFNKTSGYVIPYFNVNGKRLGRDATRIRYFPHGIAPHKYGQRKDTAPRAYFAPSLPRGMTWAKIAKDPTVPLVFTEGEKKAAKACKEGIPTIGLGGVWSFKSKRWAQEFLEELDKEFVWNGCDVTIAPSPKSRAPCASFPTSSVSGARG